MEHSELARQKRHYCAVRERLTRAARAVGRSGPVEQLERQLSELASDNAAKARRIAALEVDLADAEARLLAQAQALLSGRSADVPDDYSEGDRPTVEEIVAAVLTDFPGVSWEDVISVRRERRLVKPRHACMRAAYENRGDLSLSRIGRIFRRDHTTVLEAVRKPDVEGERG